MLPKTKRLNLSTDFKWVSSGRAVQAAHFKLFSRYGDNKIAKIGVAVSTKQFPKAVARNKVKRALFSVFEEIYQSLPHNLNILALPKQGLDEVKSEELKKELIQALEKIV